MRFQDLSEALKLQHTVFALPFAYLGCWVAQGGFPGWGVLLWVTLAMVGARTAGMAWNRLLDLPFDRRNPRTSHWPVSQGKVTPQQLVALAILFTGLLFVSAWKLNPLCLALSPIALVGLALYPTLKRFTWGCHWGIGLVLSMAPAGGWLAVTGAWNPVVLWVSGAVLFWVAGFDILYATLDLDFDRANRLYSVPQRFGVVTALRVARGCHLATVFFLGAFGLATDRTFLYWLGWLGIAILLHVEHRLVKPTDLRQVNTAFLTVNGWVSVGLLTMTILDCTFPWPHP